MFHLHPTFGRLGDVAETPPAPSGCGAACDPRNIQSVGGTALHECVQCGRAYRRNKQFEFVRDATCDRPPPAPTPWTGPAVDVDSNGWSLLPFWYAEAFAEEDHGAIASFCVSQNADGCSAVMHVTKEGTVWMVRTLDGHFRPLPAQGEP